MYSRNWVGTRMDLWGNAALTEYSYGKVSIQIQSKSIITEERQNKDK